RSVVRNLQNLWEQDPGYSNIEKIETPSKEEFFRKYWLANRPVVLKNFATDWPASKKWSVGFFRDHFGDEVVQVQTKRGGDNQYEIQSGLHRTNMPLNEFITKVLSVEQSNDFYMTSNNYALATTKLKDLFGDIEKLPEFVGKPGQNARAWHLWVGPKGTVT